MSARWKWKFLQMEIWWSNYRAPVNSNRSVKMTQNRRNSRVKHESRKQENSESSSSNSPVIKNPNTSNTSLASHSSSHVRRLILKHEILSPECDLFKASTPRRRHFSSLIQVILIALTTILAGIYVVRSEVCEGAGNWWMKWVVGLMVVISFTSITIMLLQTIEGNIWRVLYIITYNLYLYNHVLFIS